MNDHERKFLLSDPPAPCEAPIESGPLAGARVVLVSHGFQPNYERGFANGAAANGAKVTLVCSDMLDVGTLMPSIEALNLRGSQDNTRPKFIKLVNILSYHLRLMWLTLRRSRWVVHVIGTLRPVIWCGLFQGLWFRAVAKRYVLTVHNILPHDRHSAVNNQLYRLAYKLPNSLIVHTPAMKQQLIDEFQVASERVLVMEHGIEPIGRSEERLPDAFHTGAVRILFFGNLWHYKGLDILLEALAGEAPEFRLDISGSCVDADLARDLAVRVAAHPRREAITWTQGFIAEAEVPKLFLNADVLVLPYRHIDQSGVLFQALRYGLPVIATDVGSFRDYVTAEVGEICDAGNPAALAQALCRFAARRPLFSRNRIRNLAYRLEWPRVTQALAGVYSAGVGPDRV